MGKIPEKPNLIMGTQIGEWPKDVPRLSPNPNMNVVIIPCEKRKTNRNGTSVGGVRMKVSDIKIGDLIYPPSREIRLWMTKALVEKELDETALLLRVVEVRDSKPDKNGPWVFVKGQYGKEWCKDHTEPERPAYMTFLARPHTPWKVVRV